MKDNTPENIALLIVLTVIVIFAFGFALRWRDPSRAEKIEQLSSPWNK